MSPQQKKSINKSINSARKKGYKPYAAVHRIMSKNPRRLTEQCFTYIGTELGLVSGWAGRTYLKYLSAIK